MEPIKDAIQKSAQRQVRIVKFEEDGDKDMFVLGTVYEPSIPDAHGQWASEPTIFKACNNFMIDFQDLNLMHETDLEKQQIVIVQNFTAPADFPLGEEVITKGTWMLGAMVKALELKEAIKSGVITGWSLEGEALVLPPTASMPLAARKAIMHLVVEEDIKPLLPGLIKEAVREAQAKD